MKILMLEECVSSDEVKLNFDYQKVLRFSLQKLHLMCIIELCCKIEIYVKID